MSSLLEQAIVDATALKEAAMKNAEKNLIEKYSSKIKEAVDKLLEQDGAAGSEMPEETPETDLSAISNTPSDLAGMAGMDTGAVGATETAKNPLEKVKPSYLKSKSDDELITIDFSSLKAKPVTPIAPAMPTAPMAAPVAAPAAPAAPAAALAEGLNQYEEDEGEIMALEEDDSMGDLDMDTHASPVTEEETTDEEVEIDLNEYGCADGVTEGDCMEEGGNMAWGGEGGENVGISEEETQEESGAYPEEGMEQTEEEVSLEEEVSVDMDVVSDGWRGMQPNEKRELQDVALAKQQDEEYQRKMSEYEEALEASENKIKKASNKNKALVKENEELKQTLMNLKEHIEGMNLSNAKLLYMNRVLGNPSFNERQKNQIVESISRTETVEAAKIAFETLQSAVASIKQEVKAPKSLNEAVSRSSSPFLVKPRKNQENPISDRMRKLAGIIKD
jgi:hypothetical protein